MNITPRVQYDGRKETGERNNVKNEFRPKEDYRHPNKTPAPWRQQYNTTQRTDGNKPKINAIVTEVPQQVINKTHDKPGTSNGPSD